MLKIKIKALVWLTEFSSAREESGLFPLSQDARVQMHWVKFKCARINSNILVTLLFTVYTYGYGELIWNEPVLGSIQSPFL